MMPCARAGRRHQCQTHHKSGHGEARGAPRPVGFGDAGVIVSVDGYTWDGSRVDKSRRNVEKIDMSRGDMCRDMCHDNAECVHGATRGWKLSPSALIVLRGTDFQMHSNVFQARLNSISDALPVKVSEKRRKTSDRDMRYGIRTTHRHRTAKACDTALAAIWMARRLLLTSSVISWISRVTSLTRDLDWSVVEHSGSQSVPRSCNH